MIQNRTEKTYGVLHCKNYFSFYGFCKKVGSHNTQKIDVYLDDTLLNTIEANLSLTKIEQLYDLENFAFSYTLPEKYIGEVHSIHFKSSLTHEELKFSPHSLVNKEDKLFNQASFLHSLTQVQENSISSHQTIGFFLTEDSVSDMGFFDYIQRLSIFFKEVSFIAYYFDNEILSHINSLPKNTKLLHINHIRQVKESTRILVLNNSSKSNRFINEQYTGDDLFITLYTKQFSIQLKKLHKDNLFALYSKNANLFHLNSKEIETFSNHMQIVTYILLKGVSFHYNDNEIYSLNQTLENRNNEFIKIALHDSKFIENSNLRRKAFNFIQKQP